MKTYGKIVNGKFKQLNKKYIVVKVKREFTEVKTGQKIEREGTQLVLNPSEELLKAYGWKEVVENAAPSNDGTWIKSYEEVDGKIQVKWIQKV